MAFFSTHSINKDFSQKKSPITLALLIGGVFFLFLVGYEIFHTRLEKQYIFKTEAYTNIHLNLLYAHLKFEENLGVKDHNYTSNNDLSLQKAQGLLDKQASNNSWIDYFTAVFKDHYKIDVLKKGTDKLLQLTQLKEKPQNSDVLYNNIYSDLITKVKTNKNYIKNNYAILKKRLLFSEFFLISIVLLYIVVTYLKIKKYRDYNHTLTQNKNELLERLQDVQRMAKVGHFIYNYTTSQWLCDKQSIVLLGLTADKGSFEDWIEKIHPDDRDLTVKALKKRRQKYKKEIKLEYRYILNDGTTKWIRHWSKPLSFNTDGLIKTSIGVIQDITASKKYEADLIKLNKAINNSQNEVFIFNADNFKFSYVNQGAVKNLGYSVEALKAMTPLDIKPEFTTEHFEKLIEPLKNGEISKLRLETVHLRKDKTTYPVEINLSTFTLEDTRQFLAIITDLTQRKKEEKKRLEEIEKSHHFLQESQAIALLGYYTYNFKTKHWVASKIITDLMGLETEEGSLQSWVDIIHPEDKSILIDALSVRQKDHTAPLDVTYRIVNPKKDAIHWIHHIAQGLKKDDSGELLPTLGVIQDITVQKEIQRKLKDAEKRWRFAIDGTNDGLWDLNLVTKEVYYSDRWKEMLGYKPDELENKEETWENLVHPDDLERVNALAQLHFDQKTAYYTAEYRMKCKDNSYKWILDRAKVIERDANGKPLRIIGVHADITKRKYEEQIKEVIYKITSFAQNSPKLDKLLPFIKECLHTVFDTTNFYVALYDHKSQMFISHYRIDSEVVNKGKYPFQFPKRKSFSGYVIDSQKPFLSTSSFEKGLIKKGVVEETGVKSKCWLGVPLLVEKEAIGVMVLQSYTDENIFKQKDVFLLELIAANISQAIKQSRDFEKIHLLNQALEQSPDSVMITDIKGKIEYINPAFTKQYGFTPNEAVGQTPRILNSGAQSESFYQAMWETIQKGRIWEKEMINKAKDGSEFLVILTIVPVKNKAEEITHFIAIEKDITEKRQLERQFLNALVEAQETEKQSFGEELHDGISQILAAQAMYIDVMLKQNKNREDTALVHLNKVKELNTRAINDTRNIAHGLMSKQLKEVGLVKAVAQICEDYNFSKDIVFSFKHSNLKNKELSYEIKTNIFRIIQEVTTNITRHSTATKASVELIKTPDNKLKLTIKDSGVGIDLEKLKRENKGTGLKNIERRVSLLNGQMTLDTAQGKGTCYTIVVPMDDTVKLRHNG
ncbi:MAG: PAS domain S-box protein [Flavobacteriaceae bacterium]|nr:PAS domain S-box protein [Flavobacteriaceae bacterium]